MIIFKFLCRNQCLKYSVNQSTVSFRSFTFEHIKNLRQKKKNTRRSKNKSTATTSKLQNVIFDKLLLNTYTQTRTISQFLYIIFLLLLCSFFFIFNLYSNKCAHSLSFGNTFGNYIIHLRYVCMCGVINSCSCAYTHYFDAY